MADNEKLSALMDGEIIDKALINEIGLDSTYRQTWQHYHLIGDVMRGDTPTKPEWDIAESVALALEDEPVHRVHHATSEVPSMSESQPRPKQAKRHWPMWLQQLGQVAIAASVSLVVILGVQQYSGQTTQDTMVVTSEIPVLQTVPFAGSAEPVSLTREQSQPMATSEANMQEQRKRIQAMLHDYELQLRLNGDGSQVHNEPSAAEIE